MKCKCQEDEFVTESVYIYLMAMTGCHFPTPPLFFFLCLFLPCASRNTLFAKVWGYSVLKIYNIYLGFCYNIPRYEKLCKFVSPFGFYHIESCGSVYCHHSYENQDLNIDSAKLRFAEGQHTACHQRRRKVLEHAYFSAGILHRFIDRWKCQLSWWKRIRGHLQKECMSKSAFSKHFLSISKNEIFSNRPLGKWLK